ncbi:MULTISPECIES: DUF2065 domain-containing protein [unclassified Paraglaciecola]|uniref:DUF2065 domain-containing protein n=1 Tax=unclassified Paraglaciecola TaxID=2685791 RepID=UPI00131CF572|nr:MULTISPECIES: DUF2065 domain-containing protein [unclassified Paraglaciecola]|tara:strand:+ start:3162 stop:3347 length:186 start_codon:yes stop_codon:yes gene_type:complete
MLHTLLIAGALVLIIEGLGPMLFPNKWRNYLQQMVEQPANQLRSVGGVLVTIGLVSLFFLL